jgi:glycosyltransferase involved in cell wall biosynthesis
LNLFSLFHSCGYICRRNEAGMITEEILKDIVEMLDIFGPVTLEEMSGIRLMNRTDTKYLLPLETLAVLLHYAAADYRVQEVAGERNIVYHTVYLDTVDKAMYRAHQNGRAVREKIRVRTYVASQLTFLEVKNKNNKGRTDKRRIRITALDELSAEGVDDFLSLYAWYKLPQLSPQLENRFQRITLVNRAMTERLTIDTDICFRNLVNGNYAALPRLAVVELKRDGRTSSPIRDILSRLHVHPAGFSKYCMGCVLTDENLKQNRFKPKVRKMRRAEIPRNIETLIKAFIQFNSKKREHKLVLVWSNPPKSILNLCQKNIENSDIIFLKYISDKDLVSVYNGATATFFPTRYEGFGFPILESFACNTPVVTCRNTSLPEVGGNIALYTDEDGVDEMSYYMELFENENFDLHLFREQAKNYIKRFSWENTALQYVELYKSLL